MQTRLFGRTGHASTVAIFGAAALWEVTQAEADAAMGRVIAAGVNHIDVAPSYGLAEERLGPWMARDRDRFFLGCKTMGRTKAGTEAIEVTAHGYDYTEAEGWTEDPTLAIFTKPKRFALDPAEQREVKVILPTSALPCTLLGLGFRATPLHLVAGAVNALPTAVAQLAIEGPTGTEADCLAVLPAVPVAPSAPRADGLSWWWLLIAVVAMIGGLVVVARGRRRPAPRTTYGF